MSKVQVNAMAVMTTLTRCACALVGSFAFLAAAYGQDASFNPPYPRLAGGNIGGWSTYDEARVQRIAKTDVAVLGLWRGWTGGGYDAATLPAHIKALNPNIKLADYTIVIEVNDDSGWQFVHDKIGREKGAGGRGDWWLKTAAGTKTATWPGSWRVNHTANVTADANGLRFPQWWARFWDAASTDRGDWVSAGRGLKEGAWDAVFSDAEYVNSQGGVGVWADYDNNGADDNPDSQQVIDWVVGGQVAYRNAWKALHPGWGVWGNMAGQLQADVPTQSGYKQLNEGGWFEGIMGFKWSVETWGGWAAMMAQYRKGLSLLAAPKIAMFHNNLEYGVATLGYSEYRWNRYGLASCLMDNGYYMVSANGSYAEQRWYDEFDVSLGYPVDPPQTSPWSNGVYKRTFNNGLVLVNPRGNGGQTVNVGAGWKRFLGKQDPVQNNGQPVTSLFLNDGDGIILVRDGSVQPNPPAPVIVK